MSKNGYVEITYRDVKRSVSLAFIMSMVLTSVGYILNLYFGTMKNGLEFFIGYGLQFCLVTSMIYILMTIMTRMLRDREASDK